MALGQFTSEDDAVSDQTEVASALAAFGLVQERAEPLHQPYWLWPENVAPWRCWQAVQTQWRHGASGPTGLDYAGVESWLRLSRTPRRLHRTRLAQVQICERAALDAWDERRATQRR